MSRLVVAFARQVPGVEHAAVVSADGLPLAGSRSLQTDQTDQLAAVTSGIVSLVRGAARIFSGGQVDRVAIMMEQRMLLLTPAGETAVLAVLAASDSDLDLVVQEMGLFREQARAVLAAQAAMLGRD
ncbi:MAG TPA: roadblock/LC7 domain-containing protein [Streptosporangiaceae bacterium]|nr:roadblock/LC7 domain-containing protein [Streptosporangiaceae bacterium]